MKIVLLERIEKLGRLGDLVTVKNGYARNFLIPQKKALRATNENIKYFEAQRAHLEKQSHDLQTQAEGFARELTNFKLIIIRQASESGVLYGSVSSRDIAKIISEKGVSLTAAQVKISQPIKTVGVHTVPLQLHPEVRIEILVSIAPSQHEAEAQLRPAPVSEKDEDKSSSKKTETKGKKKSSGKSDKDVDDI